MRELHPDSDKPCIYGNCQAGWAVAILSAARPEMMGPIILAATMDTFDARAAIVLAVVILGTASLATWRFVPATVDAERIRRLAVPTT